MKPRRIAAAAATFAALPLLALPAAASSAAEGYALPVDQGVLERDAYGQPHHDYPAIDLPIDSGTEVFAVHSGTATKINDSSCGYGVRVEADDGGVYGYCHFESPAVAEGRVEAGAHLGNSGSTGNSTGPHLHLQIKLDDTLLCPQDLLLAIYDGAEAPALSDLPTSGCTN